MRINYNVSAMLTNNALANNDNRLSQSLERLSSGLKINHAKDNPSGLAMSKRMNAQIKGVGVAGQNTSDGISVIEIADGALSESAEILQRMNELAVKASTESLTDDDRQIIQEEIAQLKEELDRISETTEFNGQRLLDGGFDLKGYTNVEDIKVSTYSMEVPEGNYVIDSLSWTENADGTYEVNCALGEGFEDAGELAIEMADGMLTMKSVNGFEMKLDLTNATATSYQNIEIDATGIGAMRLQIGANEGQVLEVNIPAVSLKNMGIEKLDVSTVEGAHEGIDQIKDAIQYVSKVRSRLGAFQNRLESTVNSLDITEENMTAAYSRIMDVDMAEEMTNYTTNQANERPSQILQLLQ